MHAAVANTGANREAPVGGGVRDVYAATYEEAAQQVLDEYYSRGGAGPPVKSWSGVAVEEGNTPAGRTAASAREQVLPTRKLLSSLHDRAGARRQIVKGVTFHCVSSDVHSSCRFSGSLVLRSCMYGPEREAAQDYNAGTAKSAIDSADWQVEFAWMQVARLPVITEAAAEAANHGSAESEGTHYGAAAPLTRDASSRDLVRLWASRLTDARSGGGGGGVEPADIGLAVMPAASPAQGLALQRPGVAESLHTVTGRANLAPQRPPEERKPAANLFGSALPFQRRP